MTRPEDPLAALTEQLQVERQYVVSCQDINYNTATASSAHMYMALGIDNSWSQTQFEASFHISINEYGPEGDTEDDMDLGEDDYEIRIEFDIIGIDPAIANALRRILIAEVPSIAIDRVFMINNTSVIACENLAHRLGLIPIKVNPDLLEYKTAEDMPNERNTLVFKLNVTCTRVEGQMHNEKVLSRALEWLPCGSEIPEETKCKFVASQTDSLGHVGPVHDDILLAKLRPGQSIELEALCMKGIGKDHAKWSPVATAWYRLAPEVVLLKPVRGDDAALLAQELPGLVRVEGSGKARKAVLNPLRKADTKGQEKTETSSPSKADPAKAMLQLEKVRRLSGSEKWGETVQLRKKKEHFIFTIESVGILPPDKLFLQAIDVLSDKCDKLLSRL